MESSTLSSAPQVSIIIPVFNDAERLKLCLDKLVEQDFPSGDFEVIVIDNGSDQSPKELVESYPFCRFAEESTPGSYAARNKGLQLCRADKIAFTDADCLPTTVWLSAGINALDQQVDAGLVGGAIEIFARDAQSPSLVELWDCVFGLNQRANVQQFQFAATANMFTRKAIFDRVGPFEQQLKSGGDGDWGQRVAATGLALAYCPKALVRHPARQNLSSLLRQTSRHAGGRADRNRIQSRKARPLKSLAIVLAMAFPPIYQWPRIRSCLKQRGYGRLASLKVLSISTLIRWNKLYTILATMLGRTSERR